jgi:hypothetical protein
MQYPLYKIAKIVTLESLIASRYRSTIYIKGYEMYAHHLTFNYTEY